MPDESPVAGAVPEDGRKCVLVLGREEDPCCRLVTDYARRAGYRTLLLPEDQLFPHVRFTWRPPVRGAITFHGERVSFGDLAGVLYRSYGVPVTPEEYESSDGKYISAEWNALMMAWLDLLPCTVVNRLRPELWYRARLNVADLAALLPDLRTHLPRTLVTTQSDDARTFWSISGETVLYSPLTTGTVYPVRNAGDMGKLETLSRMLPMQVMEVIDGRAFNCFVVGNEIVLVGQDGNIVRSPSELLKSLCAGIGSALGILFYRLSLVEELRGDWYCLELDRLPSLHSCSSAVQQKIADGLIRIICEGEGGHR